MTLCLGQAQSVIQNIMKKLKIIYLGNFENPFSDATEKHIKYAFEMLGHEVIPINEQDFTEEDILKIKDPDMFLFHKGGTGFGFSMDKLINLLCYLTCKKVFWYFDRAIYVGLPIREDRTRFVENLARYSDYGFMTDDTWIRRHKYTNLYPLMQGIGNEDVSLGKYRKEFDHDIVFTGSIYPPRDRFVELLISRYGNRFKAYNDVFGRDLYDLCASAKIIVAPMYPSDDFHWSSRIYMILGSGGFLVHPDLYGLRKHFTEGKHFVGYTNAQELIETIDYFLDPKHEEQRKAIQMEGWKHCINNHTYLHRVKEMLDIVYGSK